MHVELEALVKAVERREIRETVLEVPARREGLRRAEAAKHVGPPQERRTSRIVLQGRAEMKKRRFARERGRRTTAAAPRARARRARAATLPSTKPNGLWNAAAYSCCGSKIVDAFRNRPRTRNHRGHRCRQCRTTSRCRWATTTTEGEGESATAGETVSVSADRGSRTAGRSTNLDAELVVLHEVPVRLRPDRRIDRAQRAIELEREGGVSREGTRGSRGSSSRSSCAARRSTCASGSLGRIACVRPRRRSCR